MEGGLTMLNGRAPYDRGEATRDGSVLDYVLTTVPERVSRLEHMETSSDHKLTVMRTRDGKEVELRRQEREKKAGEEVKLKDVKWQAWEEEDVGRYNELLAQKVKQIDRQEDTDGRYWGRRMRNANPDIDTPPSTSKS